jgi:hypothetical protein
VPAGGRSAITACIQFLLQNTPASIAASLENWVAEMN